jgi:hypothetical protein
MCAAVSWPLAALLRCSGVPCETVESDLGDCNHVWIRLEDGRALDPTADQFNFPAFKQYPPVYLGPLTELHGCDSRLKPLVETGTGSIREADESGGAHSAIAQHPENQPL